MGWITVQWRDVLPKRVKLGHVLLSKDGRDAGVAMEDRRRWYVAVVSTTGLVRGVVLVQPGSKS